MDEMHFDAARQLEAINETTAGELSIRRADTNVWHSARARRCQGVWFG
jgi:hypothetical protein